MKNRKKAPGRELSQAESALHNVQGTLETADQTKLYNVRTRFEGLINAYKDDAEGVAMLNMLMAEYSLKTKVAQERQSAPAVVPDGNIH